MTVYSFDPLGDPRWPHFVRRHPRASVFHAPGWLLSLKRTYRFAPIAITTSPPTGELRNALVLCAVRSWLTGSRLVSLPFSDHCDPLVDHADDLQALCRGAEEYRAARDWKYVELRPTSSDLTPVAPFSAAETYHFHRLDLRPSADELLRSFHADSIQRRIRRAARAELAYEEGHTESILGKLYHLLGLTRGRHLVPLQPLSWFRNLVACLGEAVSIRIVSKGAEPVAGILTLIHGKTVVYKYGGSDDRHHRLGGMPLLFWKLIEDAKRSGAEELDLGRTDRDNTGLLVFKERWAARRSTLTYWRSPGGAAPHSSSTNLRLARRLFGRLPAGVRRAAARTIYRHLG